MAYKSSETPVALTIAGSDSSAGAGIQADLKTFAALGVHGVCAVTAIVAESPGAVDAVSPVDPTLLHRQLDRVASGFPLASMKTGMLGTAGGVRAVIDFASQHPELPLVIDPVIRASAGAELLDAEGVTLLRKELLPIATLVTPNLPEVEILLGRQGNSKDLARAWFDEFGSSVLVKGGHATEGTTVVDHAVIDGIAIAFSRTRLDVRDLHGTGCTLSAAIAARLALGDATADAITTASAYLTAAMEQHLHWVESGTRALNHFPDDVGSKRS